MSLPAPYYSRDGITLYHGDCLDILPLLPSGSVDAVVTDFPYGVGVGYDGFDDTQEVLEKLVASAMPMLCSAARIVAVTPGNGNQHHYPKPDWMLCWFYGGGQNHGRWGFNCWQPILVYGKDPFMHTAGAGHRPDAVNMNIPAEANGHPCPKPYAVWRWLIDRVDIAGGTILDPFLGSGTTAVACIKTGRKCIGIEISEKYCEIAARRCEEAFASQALFRQEESHA